MLNPTFKTPTAWVPMVMSLAALGIVLGHYATYGITHETDEGTPAHLFQMLIAGQVPMVGFFAIKLLPREPKAAMQVLSLQAVGVAAAFASVFFLTGG